MSMMLNPSVFGSAPPPAGIQLVGRYLVNIPGASGATSHDLTGNLTGGIASSPAAGDFVIVSYFVYNTADRTNRTIGNTAQGAFDQLMTQYVNSVNDVSITIAHKFLDGSVDDEIDLGTPSTTSTVGVQVVFEVWRGVNTTTPMDVAHVVAAATTTGRPDPGAITPVTAGAVITVVGGSSNDNGTGTLFTSSDLTNFASLGNVQSARSGSVGAGYKAWTSGAFNAAQWGGGSTDGTDSAIAVAIALRPA